MDENRINKEKVVFSNENGYVSMGHKFPSASHIILRLKPGARFSRVPKTFRARKAIYELANRLFRRAGF